MRRPVRSPVSLATTALRSSSVCRLPFIRSSASPLRTSSTALAAAAWLCGASTIRVLPRSMPLFFAISWILAAGPTRIGAINPLCAGLDGAGQCRLLAGVRDRRRYGFQASAPLQQQLYFPVPVARVMVPRAVTRPGGEPPVPFPSRRKSERWPRRRRTAAVRTRSGHVRGSCPR